MSSTKLTPLEVLQRQKIRLQTKSDALIDILEDNFDYLQHNMGALVGDSAVSAVVSKTPPFVQDLLGRGDRYDNGEETSAFSRLALLDGALDILPMFMKGPKGWIARFVLKQAKNLFSKRK
jgi:hypothetical protein